MDREARIKLIAEGASRAAQDIAGVTSAVGKLGGAAGATQRAIAEVGKAAFRLGSDAARAMNDVKPISFQAAADSAKRFDDMVTRMSVRANRDVGALKSQFRDMGKEIGVMPDRLAQTTRALTKMTGSTDAVDAMKALGIEANDTDRSIEEMTELGATLYNKLGVPMDKIGDAIRRVNSTVKEFSTIGGSAVFEDTLIRLAPILSKIQGGISRVNATIAVLGEGKSKEVGERTTETILATFAGGDANKKALITKALRQVTGNRKYEPYVKNAQGDYVLRDEAFPLLQKYLKKKPYMAKLNLFGGDIAAMETFEKIDFGRITTEEMRLQQDADAREDAAKARRRTAQHAARKFGKFESAGVLVAPGTEQPSKFTATAAGQRAVTDVERETTEVEVGEFFQGQRDKRNRAFKGHRGAQAGIDTLKGYLPSSVERAADIGEALVVEGKGRLQASTPSQPVTVRLDEETTRKLGRPVAAAPPRLDWGKSAAAQAVEDNKAKNRGAANYGLH